MTPLRFLPLLALAACAAPQSEAPKAEAPKAPATPDYEVATRVEESGVIRVTGWLPNEDELAHLHCAAAKRARADGAAALEWVGGVAKYEGSRYAADLVYETTTDGTSVSLGGASDPADGGVSPVDAWMKYCDEAGVPREGEA